MAAQNISINGYNLQSSSIQSSKINHEAIALEESKLKIPHRDGEKLVSAVYGSRPITVEGWIQSTTASGLDGKIDELKQNLIGAQAVNMDVDYAGTTRRYTVNVKNIVVTRDYYNTTAAPFTLDIEAINPPFGQDTTTISGLVSNTTLSGSSFSTNITISGTTNPKPLVRFVVQTAGGLTDVEFKNLTTATSARITPTTFSNNDVVQIDTQNFAITQNGRAVNYTGTMPTFTPGVNNIQFNFYNTSTPIDTQQAIITSLCDNVGTSAWPAQTFQPSSSTNFNQIDLFVNKVGSPSDYLTISIYTNNAGVPGNQLASATISSSNISTTASWISAYFTSFALTAGTTYWLVATSATSFYSGFYNWYGSSTDVYSGGQSHYSSDNGRTWTNDPFDRSFKLYRTVTPNWAVGYGIEYTRWWL